MAQRVVVVPGVGQVLLVKRRGSKNLRLSISQQGQVRVSLPVWVPYAAGVAFAESRSAWLKKQLLNSRQPVLNNGDYIGKLHRLRLRRSSRQGPPKSRVSATTIDVISYSPFSSPAVQAVIKQACERALKRQADHLLVSRLEELAKSHGFHYKNIRIRRLSSRWGSCSSDNIITLSYFLIQLPWPLIDYVIVHELVHTRYLHHGPDFWTEFTRVLPEARGLQKQIRRYKPRIEPTQVFRDVT